MYKFIYQKRPNILLITSFEITIYNILQCWPVRVPHKIGGVLYLVEPVAPGVIVVYVLVHDPELDVGCCNTALKKSSLT